MFWHNTFNLIALGAGASLLAFIFKKERLWIGHAFILGILVLFISRIGTYLLFSIQAGLWRDSWYDYFRFDLGGMSFFGGFYLAFIVIFIYSKSLRLSFLHLLDLISPPAAFALAIGRFGCFMEGCCRGFVLPEKWTLPSWIPEHHLFPTPLLHSIIDAGYGLILMRIPANSANHGKRIGWFLLLFGIGRFLIEFLRTNPIIWRGMTNAQILSIPLIFMGLILVLFDFRKKNKLMSNPKN